MPPSPESYIIRYRSPGSSWKMSCRKGGRDVREFPTRQRARQFCRNHLMNSFPEIQLGYQGAWEDFHWGTYGQKQAQS